MRIQTIILRNLLNRDDYARKVLPHLKGEYFEQQSEKTLLKVISEFITQYGELPTKEAIQLELDRSKLSEDDFKLTEILLAEILKIDATNTVDWLLDKTEEFCKNSAVRNAILESWEIINGEKKKEETAIPGLLRKSLGISFDTKLGHDFIEDYEHQYEYYHRVEEKVPTGLTILDQVMNGGPSRKTLNLILAGTYVGKSLTMVHLACNALLQGFNALYITLELSEEQVRERMDANALDIPIDKVRMLNLDKYSKKFIDIGTKTSGRLILKEYATASASVLQFEDLLDELEIRKDFKPDVIFVDYLNLCKAARVKGQSDMYGYYKIVGEELRGLAQNRNIVMWSATQLNRTGFKQSDFDMDDIAESFAVSMIGDFIMGLSVTDELKQLNQIQIKQLKSRYNDIDKDGLRKFMIGVDRPKFKLYDVESSAQSGIVDESKDTPIIDKGSIDFGKFKFD